MCLGFIGITVIGLFFLLGAVRGFESADYPTLFYTGQYIGIAKFLSYMIPMAVLMIVAFVSFSILMSALFDNTAASICIPALILTAVYLLTNQLSLLGGIAQYNPLTYIDIPSVLSGAAANKLSNNNITYQTGEMIFGAMTIVCWILSAIVFSKKEIVFKSYATE